MIGRLTSSIALWAASRGESPASMLRSTFSTTTIASSTTMPIANTSPNKDRVLMEKPNISRIAKVPTIEIGTATRGMIEARQVWRNSTTTSTTRRMASKRSEEHTSELQSQFHLVCRLQLEKKK